MNEHWKEKDSSHHKCEIIVSLGFSLLFLKICYGTFASWGGWGGGVFVCIFFFSVVHNESFAIGADRKKERKNLLLFFFLSPLAFFSPHLSTKAQFKMITGK